MQMLKLVAIVEGEVLLLIFKAIFINAYFRSYWNFRKHFPAEADQLYGSLDISTQRQVEKERDAGSNGASMSASLRGSNTSLNSMPGGVLSTCFTCNFLVSLLIN